MDYVKNTKLLVDHSQNRREINTQYTTTRTRGGPPEGVRVEPKYFTSDQKYLMAFDMYDYRPPVEDGYHWDRHSRKSKYRDRAELPTVLWTATDATEYDKEPLVAKMKLYTLV